MDESNDPNDKGFATGEDNFKPASMPVIGQEDGHEFLAPMPYFSAPTLRTNNASGSTEITIMLDDQIGSAYNPFNSVCSGAGSLLSFGTLISHHSPEMIVIPPNPAFGYLEIVRAVAETDVTRPTATDLDDVLCNYCCPFCNGYIAGRLSEPSEFPHDQDCIVLKARAMVEDMPHVEGKE